MTSLEQQVRFAQRRLWLNRWLRQWGWWLLYAVATWTLAWIIDRLFSLHLPMDWAALIALAGSLIGSTLSWARTREPHAVAATALDQAAGLKERVSTGLHVWNNADDPFAQAVVADAHHAISGLSARKFIPLRWPRSMSFSAAMVCVALLSLLLPEFDLLKKKEARAAADAKQQRLTQMRTAVAKPVSAIQKMAEEQSNPDVQKEIKALQDTLQRDVDPNVTRRDVSKQLDRLEDVLKNKIDSERFKALDEAKKRLKQIGAPDDPKGQLAPLMEALTGGDMKEAQQQLKKAQEMLAKHARDPNANPKQLEQMKKQLEQLSKKVEKAAEDKQSERDMKNAGLNEKDIQRALDTLAKKDPKQLEKLAQELADRLKDKGMTKEQMEKLLNQVQQRQQASKQLEQLAQKMSKGAQAMDKGDTKEAQSQMGQAEQQLSEMEQMEQQLNDMESQMAQLDQAREGLNDADNDKERRDEGKCGQCNGTGFKKDGSPCAHCKGTGRGRGPGQGSGLRERDDDVDVAFKNKKDKTQERKGGSIIGQQFVKGQQLKNKSEVELFEAAKAAEIDATDSLDRERIPRIYRKAVRSYFDRISEPYQGAQSASTTQPAKSP